jgi:hypothetical protein
MANKGKETSVDISANESLIDAIMCISNDCKDTEYLQIGNLPEWIKEQDKILLETFSNGILTMKQASYKTGIDRSNICWFVHDQRETHSIWKCGRGIDRITRSRASFWTTNKDLAVKFYKETTKHLWRDLPKDGQEMIFKAIESYLSVRGLGFFISSAMSEDDDILETWHRIKESMDQKMI